MPPLWSGKGDGASGGAEGPLPLPSTSYMEHPSPHRLNACRLTMNPSLVCASLPPSYVVPDNTTPTPTRRPSDGEDLGTRAVSDVPSPTIQRATGGPGPGSSTDGSDELERRRSGTT